MVIEGLKGADIIFCLKKYSRETYNSSCFPVHNCRNNVVVHIKKVEQWQVLRVRVDGTPGL